MAQCAASYGEAVLHKPPFQTWHGVAKRRRLKHCFRLHFITPRQAAKASQYEAAPVFISLRRDKPLTLHNMKHSAYAPYDLSSIALRATDDEKMKNEIFPFITPLYQHYIMPNVKFDVIPYYIWGNSPEDTTPLFRIILRLSLKKLKKLLIMLHYGQKFLLKEKNMALCSCLRVTFLCLAGIFFLFTLLFELWQKKWNRLCLDIFVYLIQMPLWIILGIAILIFFPDLVYSYFPGIWMISGLLLWMTPHCIMTATAIRRKDRFDIPCSIAGLLSIISFCVFIYFWDLTKNVF